MCYLGGIWRRLEQLERVYGRFPSVDQSSRFVGVPNLGKPLYREKTVYIKTHKRAINRPVGQTGPHRRDVKHILSKISCSLLQSFHFVGRNDAKKLVIGLRIVPCRCRFKALSQCLYVLESYGSLCFRFVLSLCFQLTVAHASKLKSP